MARKDVKYRTVVIDPPWMERGGGRIKRGADRHYPLMKTRDITRLLKNEILPLLDDDCHLYLWVTNNFLPDGFEVLQELGFTYITCITWAKDRTGLGQYYRGMTEHCLFARRGMLPYRKRSDGKRAQGTTLIQAPRTIHSRKPELLRQYAELVSHPPRLEVFARERPVGWSVWGDEV